MTDTGKDAISRLKQLKIPRFDENEAYQQFLSRASRSTLRGRKSRSARATVVFATIIGLILSLAVLRPALKHPGARLVTSATTTSVSSASTPTTTAKGGGGASVGPTPDGASTTASVIHRDASNSGVTPPPPSTTQPGCPPVQSPDQAPPGSIPGCPYQPPSRDVPPNQAGGVPQGPQYDTACPYIQSVAPQQGPASGGTDVTITGGNFNKVKAVLFGALRATQFTIQSPTELSAVTPPDREETVAVTLQANQCGAGGYSERSTFTYT